MIDPQALILVGAAIQAVPPACRIVRRWRGRSPGVAAALVLALPGVPLARPDMDLVALIERAGQAVDRTL